MVFRHPSFTVEPWSITESVLDIDNLARTESVFALSNGHLGLRGNLDEGEPHGLPGTYLNSVYELHPLPYAEAGFGYPESGQTVVNVTNGKLIRLLVGDEPFDVRYGQLLSHRRVLDLRAGVLRREVEWRSPAGAGVRVSSIRLVSFVERAVAAISYEVEALEAPVRIVVQSELVANEPLPARPAQDPRVAAVLEQPLVNEETFASTGGGMLVHRVRQSGILLAAAMDHQLAAPEGAEVTSESTADVARVTVICTLEPLKKLTFTKFLAYGWSAERSRPALHDQVRGALQLARHTGWAGLVAAQREYLDDFWAGADVELDGDPEVQQAVRFSMFHVLQAGARSEGRPVAAKGLTGPGYDGHSFWDTEVYVCGLLSLARPEAVADELRWRNSTLPMARDRARQLGFSGAAFPWRTINGEECSAYWPAGTAAFHVSAAIAHAVVRYVRVTGDQSFEREVGLELLVETARLWRALGHHHVDGSFRIDGVTGPDEYSALADNNVYTNLMAQLNLGAAASACARHPDRAALLGVRDGEAASWRDAARDMYIPFDDRLGVHPQAEGFTDHERWDFSRTRADQYPLMLHFPYFDLYRKQVVKQADLVLAMHLRGDAFTSEQKARNFDYYERITVRDSSLSSCTQAVIAAETGSLGLAYDYVRESSLIDLADLEHDTRDGLHVAALAGAWVALVEGLGGVRVEESRLVLRPRLPDVLRGLRFRILFRGRRLEVDVHSDEVGYRLLEGDALSVWHYDSEVLVTSAASEHRDIPPAVVRAEPAQPPGRGPRRRGRR
ncbi:MAG TPA: glycosyl hydrolase family 65 protein [Acidimicrobiales bacterium]|nr:glycosyl hydrolase family 65 protein [Acidimicrobiales bacterium]